MTRAQLAEASGLPLSRITALEKGTAKTINSNALLRLARALETTVDQMFLIEESGDELTATQAQVVDTLIEKLDDVEFSAIMQMIRYMVAGTSNEMAFAACNDVLTANGRKPLPCPPIAAPSLNSAGSKKEVAV